MKMLAILRSQWCFTQLFREDKKEKDQKMNKKKNLKEDI